MYPFFVRASNDIEGLSLSLLVITSLINSLKAALIDNGIIPSGPSVPFFKGLELCEKLFVLIILAYILFIESNFWTRLQKWKCCRNRKSGTFEINEMVKCGTSDDTECTHL